MLGKGFFTSLIISSIASTAYASNMAKFVALTDEQLSKVQGQSLMILSYIAPDDQANNMPGKNIGFYKLGLESLVEINANIRKLQLGCGGINGPGGCDLDIDNLSLSGFSEDSTGRATSSAEISNPFMEFAIKNPNSSATREITGLKFSAEKVKGLLTMGTENSLTPNGLNSFSGYMKIKEAYGTATTQARNMTYADTEMSMNGRIKIKVFIFDTVRDFSSNDYNLNLSSTNSDLTIYGQEISGTRIKSAQLSGLANINQINFAGDLKATVDIMEGLTLNKKVDGSITGLKANVNVDQNLGFIHRLPLDNPFSLSLQYEQLFWPHSDAPANKGWWLAFDDAIDIGNVTPSQQIQITNDVLKQIIGPISDYLTEHPSECQALNCVISDSLPIGNIDLPNTTIQFPLKDLHLANQNFAPNCYGGLKFC